MTKPKSKIDPQIEFPKVEKMLCSLAWKVAQACPVTFEESRSEAYLAFMLACQTYDSRRGSKFSSWCYFKVWTSLRSWITKRTRDPLICTEMNDELKEKERWNDPAAQFLVRKEGGKGKSGKWTKQVYRGAAAPNRYGIRPGYRWDGVDRGNGWENERFKALNRVARNKELDYAWQEDT